MIEKILKKIGILKPELKEILVGEGKIIDRTAVEGARWHALIGITVEILGVGKAYVVVEEHWPKKQFNLGVNVTCEYGYDVDTDKLVIQSAKLISENST